MPSCSQNHNKEEAARKARARAAARARTSQAIRQARATARRTKGTYKPRASSFVTQNKKQSGAARTSFLDRILKPVTTQFKRVRSAATRTLRRSEPRTAAARARSSRIRSSSLNVGRLSRISREIKKLQRNKNAATSEANKRKIQNKINSLRSQRSNVMAMYG